MSHAITITPADRRFEADDGEPILAAAIRQGVGLPYGCRDGACGSCKSRLVEGRVEHGAHQLKALSPAEEEEGWILTCCAVPQTDCVVQVRSVPGAGEFPALRMPTRVISIERAAPDVAILRLQLPANQQLRWRAGQYVEFILKSGARRSYSMANAPAEVGDPPAIELHVRHMPGGQFTDHVFGAMKEKEILRMEGPYGSFFVRNDSRKPIVLLASGTGYAPVQSMLQQLRLDGSSRPAVLYWGARRRADLYRHEQCVAAAAELPWLRYVPVLSEAAAEDAWTGRTGFVHRAVIDDLPDLSGHQVYACGTPAMVEAAQRDFTAVCGLPADEFYADAFTSEADKHDDPADADPRAPAPGAGPAFVTTPALVGSIPPSDR